MDEAHISLRLIFERLRLKVAAKIVSCIEAPTVEPDGVLQLYARTANFEWHQMTLSADQLPSCASNIEV